jgi:hypothetical protein
MAPLTWESHVALMRPRPFRVEVGALEAPASYQRRSGQSRFAAANSRASASFCADNRFEVHAGATLLWLGGKREARDGSRSALR